MNLAYGAPANRNQPDVRICISSSKVSMPLRFGFRGWMSTYIRAYYISCRVGEATRAGNWQRCAGRGMPARRVRCSALKGVRGGEEESMIDVPTQDMDMDMDGYG